MYPIITVDAEVVGGIVDVGVEVIGNVETDAELVSLIRTTNYEDYSGPLEITPSEETQTLQTAERVVHDVIVINPIPSNYGLITWNGSYLTIT